MNAETPPAGLARPVLVWAALGLLALAVIAFGVARIFAPHGALAPDFTLTDQDGQPYTLSAQHGHPVALFFGYTHCPDVCPTTLAALARAKQKLGTAAKEFQVVFVTVDPQRDTTAVIKRYVRLFDPSFIGLGGTEAQLMPVYAAYHIFQQKLPAHDSAAGYLMAHSSIVTFIGPDGRLRGFDDGSDSPDELVAQMRAAS